MSMFKRTVLIAAILAVAACVPMSDERARAAVEASGMTDVEITGMAFFGCADKDYITATFRAKTSAGKAVSGVVCGGILKGSTVRID